MTNNRTLKIFFVLMLLSYQIISSDIYYMDDIFRHVLGYAGWVGDGRPFADMLYHALSFGNSIIDLHPMLLISSILLYSFTMSMYAKANSITSNYIYAIACSVIIINPFFISNLWFRYDGPFMVLSICMAIIPFCIRSKSTTVLLLTSITSVLVAVGLYQTSINIFLAFSLMELSRNVLSKKINNSIATLAVRALAVVIAMVLYKTLTTTLYPMSEYAKAYSKMVSLNTDGFFVVLNNIKLAYEGIDSALNSFWIFTIPCGLAFIFLMFNDSYRLSKCTAIITILSAASIIMLSFGVIIFSQSIVIYPRIYLGFGCSLFFAFVYIAESKLNKYISLFLIGVPFVFISLYSFAENSSIKAEYKDKNELAKRLTYDISSEKTLYNKCIMVMNYPKLSKTAELNIKALPYIYNVLPKTFSPGYDGGRFMLMANGLNDIRYQTQDEELIINKEINDTLPSIENDTYSLYSISECTVIKFK